MKTWNKWVLWSAIVLSVLTAVTLLVIISDLSLFRNNPLIFILSTCSATVALSVMIHNHYQFPVLKNLRIQGRMIISSLALLILSVPAAVMYIYYNLNGEEGLKLLSALFVSLSAVFFFATLYTFTMPSRSAVLYLFRQQKGGAPLNVMIISAAAVLALFILTLAARVITRTEVTGLVLVLPLFALLQVILDVTLSVDSRNAISRKLAGEHLQEPVSDTESSIDKKDATNGFRSVLLFQEHYLDLICGKRDYLINRAGDSYATEVVRTAGQTFDPALLPSLKVIASGMRFSESVRQQANAVISAIEKYYADPVRNAEMLKKPGISERTAAARAMLISRRKPQSSDVMRLINDPDPEVRRAAMAIAGYFDIRDLREEAMLALSSAETEKEAYYLLARFGPDSFRNVIGPALKQHHSERVGLMLIRLLNLMPLGEAVPYLKGLITSGSVGVRLAAAKYLCRYGGVSTRENSEIIEESLNTTVHTIARLTSLYREASKNKYFLLSEALRWERSMHMELLYCLLSLLTGPVTAHLIRKNAGSDTAEGAIIAAEIIDTAMNTPARRPVRALLGNNTDTARLNSLSAFYPIREIKGELLTTMILSSEQNITGIWTKACALRKISAAGHRIGKELALSYLFSNNPLLQEEAAGVIRMVNPGWFREAECRLPGQVRQKVAAVISNSVPGASLIFDKTRFLSLCFSNIPEERIIMLASCMNYSESYDTGFTTGQMTWIVPSHHGKSGLYSLPVSDISSFIFHYPEYTDIFVNYIDNNRVVTVKG